MVAPLAHVECVGSHIGVLTLRRILYLALRVGLTDFLFFLKHNKVRQLFRYLGYLINVSLSSHIDLLDLWQAQSAETRPQKAHMVRSR